MRYCNICTLSLPEENFDKYANQKFGEYLKSYCRKCNRKKSLKWHNDNRQKALVYMKKWDTDNSDILAFNMIKNTAKRRKLVVSISKESFCNWFNITPHVCDYCGLSEEESKIYFKKRITIDRKDNNLGYEENNLVLACNLCNFLKGDFFTYLEWKEISEKYVKNRIREYSEIKLKRSLLP
jgi:hypothetical protein